jgi:5-methylcytosine-specific restriction endonuclease McrA
MNLPFEKRESVNACEACNSRKGARSPQEVGMMLNNLPQAPTHPTVAFAQDFWREQATNFAP